MPPVWLSRRTSLVTVARYADVCISKRPTSVAASRCWLVVYLSCAVVCSLVRTPGMVGARDLPRRQQATAGHRAIVAVDDEMAMRVADRDGFVLGVL